MLNNKVQGEYYFPVRHRTMWFISLPLYLPAFCLFKNHLIYVCFRFYALKDDKSDYAKTVTADDHICFGSTSPPVKRHSRKSADTHMRQMNYDNHLGPVAQFSNGRVSSF